MQRVLDEMATERPQVTVRRVSIRPWSTVGFGWGTTEDGRTVRFLGDHRPMRHIGEAVEAGVEVVLDWDDLLMPTFEG